LQPLVPSWRIKDGKITSVWRAGFAMFGMQCRCILRSGRYALELQKQENDEAEPLKHDGLDSKVIVDAKLQGSTTDSLAP